jgi:tubulin polyglutamylase TTLL1
MSLKAVQSVIINDKHCFELYGFDVLLDDNCKPWLIEINSSPSLSTTTKRDKILKMDVLRSIYEIVIPEDWGDESGKYGTNTCTQTRVGGFSILYDEAQDNNSRKNVMSSKRNTNKIWR